MSLSPEDRRKIYEEEKAKIDAGQKPAQEERTLTNLRPGVAALLCYLGFWITGIIFLVLEQKNRFIRFHAAQSIVVFGFLNIVAAMLGPIPFVGWFFSTVTGVLAFVLWLVLMIRASNEEMFKLPVAGDLAEKMIGPASAVAPVQEPPAPTTQAPVPPLTPPPAVAPVAPATQAIIRNGQRGHAGRIVGSAFVIAWSIALMVFLTFFHDYIAHYQGSTVAGVTHWVRTPILTSDFHLWLPIVNTVLAFTIAGHILMLAIDKYILREPLHLVLDIFSLVSVAALLAIYPFDWSPFGTVADALDLSAHLMLALTILGISIGILVRFIKIIVNVARGTATYAS